jgi:hypothetical protein
MYFLISLLRINASVCYEHYLLILRRPYTSGAWHTACMLCQLAALQSWCSQNFFFSSQWYVFMFCIMTLVCVHVLYYDTGLCSFFVLWHWYVSMFCIMTMVCVHVLYYDTGMHTWFVLSHWHMYVFCISVVCAHLLYLLLCYACMFCTVTAGHVHVLYCDTGTLTTLL